MHKRGRRHVFIDDAAVDDGEDDEEVGEEVDEEVDEGNVTESDIRTSNALRNECEN